MIQPNVTRRFTERLVSTFSSSSWNLLNDLNISQSFQPLQKSNLVAWHATFCGNWLCLGSLSHAFHFVCCLLLHEPYLHQGGVVLDGYKGHKSPHQPSCAPKNGSLEYMSLRQIWPSALREAAFLTKSFLSSDIWPLLCPEDVWQTDLHGRKSTFRSWALYFAGLERWSQITKPGYKW